MLPSNYEAFLRRYWKAENVDMLVQGLQAPASVSIRINQKRFNADAQPVGADGRVPWCPEGVYLKERPQFTADPLLHAGAYYVQEASSMFLAHVLRSVCTTEDMHTALDLCAAPGGKSTLLRSILPDDCRLTSNEPNRQRAQVLAENLAKWGHPNVCVTQTLAADIARTGQLFDLILTDVPCSGEGMFRKEPEAVRQWSPALVDDCATLQRSIVEDIWPALRAGGTLIYSTCTFNPEEDENNVEWIARTLGAEVIAIPTDPEWGIFGDLRQNGDDLPCCHFLPGHTRGEGFFIAVLRKHGTAEEQPQPKANKKGKKGRGQDEFSLNTLPTNQLDEDGVPQVEVSIEDAIRYLQRESLTLPPETPRGHVQVCFRGLRLGLMNNLGSRANNLYPKEWRIRSGFIEPQTLFT